MGTAALLTDYIRLYNVKIGKQNGIIRRHFGKQMTKVIQLRLCNIRPETPLKFGRKTEMLKKRDEQKDWKHQKWNFKVFIMN